MEGRFEIGRVMTSKELAEYLNLHVATIGRLAKRGEIPAFRVAEHWRFRLDAIEDWLRESQKWEKTDLANRETRQPER